MIKVFLDEIKTIFKDPGTLLIVVGGFFLYGLFYTIPFSGDILKEVPIAVVDFDDSNFSRELTRNFDVSENLNVKYVLKNENEAKKLYFRGDILSYLIIPKDFQKNILKGGYSTIASFEDSAYLIIYKQVASGVLTSAISYGSKLEAGAYIKKGIPYNMALSLKIPFEFIQNPLYNPISSYQNYILPLVLILIMQQTAFVGLGLLAGTIKEKIYGYKDFIEGRVVEIKENLLAKYECSHFEIVFGKSMAHFSIYFAYSILCIFVFPAFVNYKMSFNLSSFLIIIPFIFSVSYLAQSLLAIFQKREDSMFLFVPMSVPLIFLTGFIWPREAIPFVLNILSYLIPSTPAIDALIKINQMGGEFYMVERDFIILVLQAFCYYFMASFITKKYKNISC